MLQARIFTNLLHCRDAIEHRHAQVKQQDVGLRLIDHIEGFLTVARFKYRIFPHLQQFAKQFTVDGIVFGEKDFDHSSPAAEAILPSWTTRPISMSNWSLQLPSFCQ